MRIIPLGLATLAAIACACTAQSRGIPPEKLQQYTTPGYALVMSDGDEASLLATRLSQISSLLTTLAPELGASNGFPATIFVTPHHHWNKYFADGELDSGRLTQRFSYFVVLAGWRSGGGLRTAAYYEYAGLFMQTHYPGRLPLWYELGMANLAYGAALDSNGATIGLDPFDSPRMYGGTAFSFRSDLSRRLRKNRLRAAELLRLEDTSPAYADYDVAEQAEFQSWKLIHRAYVVDLDLGRQIHDYLGRVARFETPEDAAQKAFGKSLDEFDADMADYEKNSRSHFRQVQFSPAPVTTLSTPREIDSSRAVLMVARALVDSGSKPAKIARILEDAANSKSDYADLLALKMRVAIRERDDTTLGLLIKEAEAHIGQPRVARELALALYERVHEEVPGSGEDFPGRQAMRERALNLLAWRVIESPDDIEAVWSHAMLAAVLKRNLDVAQDGITRARERLPRSPDLALAAALVKDARGQGDSAVEDLMGIVRFTSNAELRLWAARHIDMKRREASLQGSQP